MDSSFESLFGFYEFTSGRRLFALRQVRALAHEQDFTELVKHCDAAVTHELATRELERRWAGEPADTGTNPAAQRIDVLVDRTLGAIRDHVVAQTQGAAPDDPIHAATEAFLKRIFPAGVYAVTSAPFFDESAAVDDIVGLLKGELASEVKEFGLGRLAKRLAELAAEYREALNAPPPSLIAWGQVRAARAEGQSRLLEAVAIIVGKHHRLARASIAVRGGDRWHRRGVGPPRRGSVKGSEREPAPSEERGQWLARGSCPGGGDAVSDPRGSAPRSPRCVARRR